MATYTDNLHLEKPAQSDLYNISVFNGNADIIDSAMAARALAQNQATIEASSTASRNYAKGEFLVYNGLLYKVTSAIASGGMITPGTNCVATNTGAELKSLNDSLKYDAVQISDNSLRLERCGRIRMLHAINYTNANLSSGSVDLSSSILGTDAPAYNVRCAGHNNNGGAAELCFIELSSSRKLSLYKGNTRAAATSVSFTLCWVTNA